MHASQPAQGGVALPASVRAALRGSLAAIILKTQSEAAVEANHWRQRAQAAEAEAKALREGVLADLALERAPADLHAAVRAVGAVCRSADDTASFMRQARIVQTVRELSAGGSKAGTPAPAAASSAPGRASPHEVAAFVVELLTSMEVDEPPKHAQAFVDAAFRFLVAAPAAEAGGSDALDAACGALCDSVLAHGVGSRDCRACVRTALCRLAKQQGVRGARAALLAAAERLRAVAERCAEVARAAAAPPSAALLSAPAMDVDSELSVEEEAQRLYDNVYYLVRVVEAALAALAAPRRGAGAAEADAAATTAMEVFARVHARAQRCADPLRPRFGLLSVAVRRVTAAANLCALELLSRLQGE